MMTLDQATRIAAEAVLGKTALDEYRAAQAAFARGLIDPDVFATLRQSFDNLMGRRRDEIARQAQLLLAPAVTRQCFAVIRGARCDARATTVVATRWFCETHAAVAPRLPPPARVRA